jgi:hypothetical protein
MEELAGVAVLAKSVDVAMAQAEAGTLVGLRVVECVVAKWDFARAAENEKAFLLGGFDPGVIALGFLGRVPPFFWFGARTLCCQG